MAAINGHAAHAWEQHIRDLIEKRGMNIQRFVEATYGDQTSVGTKPNSGRIYPILKGQAVLTEETAEKWAASLGTTPEALLEANAQVRALRPDGRVKKMKRAKGKAAAVSPRRSRAALFGAPPATPPLTAAVGATRRSESISPAPPFSMVVNPDGTVAVKLDMSLSLDQALKLVDAIGLPALIAPPEAYRPLRIEHEKETK